MSSKRRRVPKIGFLLVPVALLSIFCLFSHVILHDGTEEKEELTGRCEQKNTCLDCLFYRLSETSSATAPLSGDCFWCAMTARCMSVTERVKCLDRDEKACPAVLHSVIPNTFRVIHVAIRKGGPEALIQLHLALNRWGFRTTLDTRHSRKEKGGPVVPFFQEMYKSEFNRAPPLRWVKTYNDWHKSAVEGDVLIATETWPCVKVDHLTKGVRQMQWHLTVWRRRDRTECTIAGHTNYVTITYMNQSKLALLYPYVSPHIVKLAQSRSTWFSAKRKGGSTLPLVLYDSDTTIQSRELMSRHGVSREAIKATGFTPEKLYELYGEAAVGIDLALPGAERFVFEAVLFDVCIIVDDALVGGDKEDVPLPDEFRVAAGNIEALNAAIDRCIRDYDTVIGQFAKLKQVTLEQKTTFERQVRRYFSNSVHIVSVVCSTEQSKDFLARFILNTLILIPFATVEIRLAHGITGLASEQHKHLLNQSWLAAVHFTTMDTPETHEVCGKKETNSKLMHHSIFELIRSILYVGDRTVFTNEKRSLLTIFAPIDLIILDEEIIHYITSQLSFSRKRRIRDSNLFPLFIHEEANLKNDSTNPTFLAMWTSNASQITCASIADTGVVMFGEICKDRHNTNHMSRKAVLLRESKMQLSSRVDARDIQRGVPVHVRNTWDFMCLHPLWKDFVGGC